MFVAERSEKQLASRILGLSDSRILSNWQAGLFIGIDPHSWDCVSGAAALVDDAGSVIPAPTMPVSRL